MRIFVLLTTFSCLLLSSGCALHQVKGEVAGVEVEAKTTEAKTAHTHGEFCPPGQAKKGYC